MNISAQNLKDTLDNAVKDINGLLEVIQTKENPDEYDKGFKAALERCLDILKQ